MNSIIPCVFAVLLAVNVATGLQCYNCEEKNGETCTWESKTCATDENRCYRISVLLPNGKEYIKRGCLPGDNCEIISMGVSTVLQKVFGIDVKPNCVTCQGDKCNSAKKLTGFTFFGLVVAAVALLLQ